MDLEGDKNLMTPELKKMLGPLASYLIRHLGIRELPTLKLVNSQKNADNPLGLTGHYDHQKKQITLYITGRHDIDICRSFCHEMIHHWQNERGTLHPEDKNEKLPTDNNTSPHYAQNNLWLRKREMEAYLLGSLLFRDFEDEQRYGPSPNEPLLPKPYD